MANVKITELPNLTNPSPSDVMLVVDVDADVTKKVSVGEVVGAALTAGTGISVTNGSGSITLAIDSDTAISDITTTATSGTLPTPDGSVTIADASTPTVTELLEYCVELEAKLEAVLTALRTVGVIAT